MVSHTWTDDGYLKYKKIVSRISAQLPVDKGQLKVLTQSQAESRDSASGISVSEDDYVSSSDQILWFLSNGYPEMVKIKDFLKHGDYLNPVA